ncbi:hypothetical protein [Methylomagnum ishizawai]|uniref:hypothetical protein n=1 Tax=Methylomagnum ishizawai TaxID=1760988 RepID=UPI001C33CC90|nr:hypothetical protein [Methylomagnum ishizawai]BBL74397.1 hypothetical protein MishRS11D_14950 [Methylomagnum ishizawai]
MEQASNTVTLILGLALIAAVGFEIHRKREKLRELYNVLEADDAKVVAELDRLVDIGQLKPWTGGSLA